MASEQKPTGAPLTPPYVRFSYTAVHHCFTQLFTSEFLEVSNDIRQENLVRTDNGIPMITHDQIIKRIIKMVLNVTQLVCFCEFCPHTRGILIPYWRTSVKCAYFRRGFSIRLYHSSTLSFKKPIVQ